MQVEFTIFKYFYFMFNNLILIHNFDLGSSLSIVIFLLFIHSSLKIVFKAFLKTPNNWIKNKIESTINHIETKSYIEVLEMVYLEIVLSGFL